MHKVFITQNKKKCKKTGFGNEKNILPVSSRSRMKQKKINRWVIHLCPLFQGASSLAELLHVNWTWEKKVKLKAEK